MEREWELFNTDSYTVAGILEVIDDALCHGFEFKIENAQLYFRETV